MIKSCATSIRGEPRLSPVQSASKAKRDKVLCSQHPRQTKQKIKEKGKKILKKGNQKKRKSKKYRKKKKGEKEKEFAFSSLGQNLRLLSLPYS